MPTTYPVASSITNRVENWSMRKTATLMTISHVVTDAMENMPNPPRRGESR